MINLSVILCLVAGIFGIYALVKYFCILRADIYTSAFNAMPIIIGTLAWLSAAVTFSQSATYNSPINFERTFMIVTWIWMILRLRYYRNLSLKCRGAKCINQR